MTENQIRILLAKYWRAETTVKEERALKKYFRQRSTSYEFMGDEQFFQFIREFQETRFIKDSNARVEKPTWKSIFRSVHTFKLSTLRTLIKFK